MQGGGLSQGGTQLLGGGPVERICILKLYRKIIDRTPGVTMNCIVINYSKLLLATPTHTVIITVLKLIWKTLAGKYQNSQLEFARVIKI